VKSPKLPSKLKGSMKVLVPKVKIKIVKAKKRRRVK